MMQKEKFVRTVKAVSFMEELIEKILSSSDADSIGFIKKHQNIFKTNYLPNNYHKKVSLSLDDLIDEDEYQILSRRPIYFKEGLTHLKLLLLISSENKIKNFYKKIQNKKIADPDNPDHAEIADILNRYLSNPKRRENKPSPKVNLELLKNLKQMTTDSMKKNYLTLINSKKEYRHYTEKAKILSVQFKNKLKEKYAVENEVLKINEENERINALKKSVFAGKKKLRNLKKRIDLFSRYIDLELKEKLMLKFAPKAVGKGKVKYAELLECFKDQKVEVKSIWKEIQKFSNNRSEVNEKYSNISEALSQLERSLENDISYKDSLIKEIKSLNTYAEYLDLEQQEKTKKNEDKSSISLNESNQGKNKYKQLAESYKKQKTEVNSILDEIQKFTSIRNEIYKKYSDTSDELLQLEHNLKNDTTYKDSLGKEVRLRTCKIKDQQSELQYMDKISDSYHSLESCILIESNRTKRSLEIQSKISGRYKASNDSIQYDFDFNRDKYEEHFSDIHLETESLCKNLDSIHRKNKKILKHGDNLANKILKDKKWHENIKSELLDELLPKRAVKLRKKISKNGRLLTKKKNRINEFEEALSAVRKEKDDKLFSLKEKGDQRNTLIAKWQIFVELTREKIFDNENLLMDVYEKLIGLRIDLATTYEVFEISCVYNDKVLKTILDIHTDIEDMLKNILLEIQSTRKSLKSEERNVILYIKEQQGIKEKYKEFCGKFNGAYFSRGDIEVLIYQNADLEKKLNELCLKDTLSNDRRKVAFEISNHAKRFKDKLNSKSDNIKSRKKLLHLVPQLKSIESFPLLQTGVVVFFILSFFSYLLIYNTNNIYDNKRNLLAFNLEADNAGNDKLIDEMDILSNIPDYKEKINQFDENNSEKFIDIEKVNILSSNSLNILPSPLLPESNQEAITDDVKEMERISTLWTNYVDIFDDLRFDSPINAFRLFEIMMNRQAVDLTLMDSIQLLYSIRRVLKSEEGFFFDRLFHDFIKFGYEKKEAAANILHNNRLIEKIYNKNIHYVFKGRFKPIAMLEKMPIEDFEKMIVPYIITNYKAFAKFKNISVPENINTYAKNLAQDIYICAKKFRVPVTSLLTIAHQESFFINLLGDRGKSASPFQIYNPTKQLILKNMRRDGFRIPVRVSNLENHVTFATFIAAYHFANLIKNYARPIIDPISHKPTALIVNLKKSTKFYNGGKHYAKKVLLKQNKLDSYLKYKMNRMPVTS